MDKRSLVLLASSAALLAGGCKARQDSASSLRDDRLVQVLEDTEFAIYRQGGLVYIKGCPKEPVEGNTQALPAECKGAAGAALLPRAQCQIETNIAPLPDNVYYKRLEVELGVDDLTALNAARDADTKELARRQAGLEKLQKALDSGQITGPDAQNATMEMTKVKEEIARKTADLSVLNQTVAAKQASHDLYLRLRNSLECVNQDGATVNNEVLKPSKDFRSLILPFAQIGPNLSLASRRTFTVVDFEGQIYWNKEVFTLKDLGYAKRVIVTGHLNHSYPSEVEFRLQTPDGQVLKLKPGPGNDFWQYEFPREPAIAGNWTVWFGDTLKIGSGTMTGLTLSVVPSSGGFDRAFPGMKDN